MKLNRKIKIFAVIVTVCSMALSAAATLHLDRMLATKAVDGNQMALFIKDLETGEVLESFNADASLIPASILKTVTIATLLPMTGCEYRYQTRVYADGPIRNGHLEGNLLVVGSGDPSINAGCDPAGPDFIGQIADWLKEHGVKSIEGDIVIDSSIFTAPATPDSWVEADKRQKYGAGCFGLNYRHNASGSASVADPASIFRSALTKRLETDGIALGKKEMKRTKSPKLLGTHSSASIDEIMRSCMMRSDNLFAEALLRTIPVVKGKEGDTSLAADIETKYWASKGLKMDGVKIVDGSGLSRSNRVTAEFIGEVLSHLASDPDYASFLPLAGQEGTLKSFLKDTPLDSYFALKTGSMNGIQCYAGYKLDDEFVPTHVVVLILNSLPAGRPAARSAFERYLLDFFI